MTDTTPACCQCAEGLIFKTQNTLMFTEMRAFLRTPNPSQNIDILRRASDTRSHHHSQDHEGSFCVVCGVRRVVCEVWRVVCGVRRVVCGVRRVVCGVRRAVCGVQCVACSVPRAV